MVISTRCLPTYKYIKKKPELFVDWIKKQALLEASVVRDGNTYKFSKGDILVLVFNSKTGEIQLVEREIPNTDFVVSRLYDFRESICENENMNPKLSEYLCYNLNRDCAVVILFFAAFVRYIGLNLLQTFSFWLLLFILLFFRVSIPFIVKYYEGRKLK